MTGCIHQVENIFLARLAGIVQAHGLCLDGDTALTLNIHIIQNLFGHLALAQTAANLYQAVSQGGFAMVNMGNNGKITNMAQLCHGLYLS